MNGVIAQSSFNISHGVGLKRCPRVLHDLTEPSGVVGDHDRTDFETTRQVSAEFSTSAEFPRWDPDGEVVL